MRRLGLVWLLLAALLWAPLLGQLHRGSHGLAHAAASAHVHADPAQAGTNEALFNHDDGSEGCRLYDQLTCADTLAGLPQVAVPLLLTAFLFRRLERNAVARRAALFNARGPPVLR